MARNQYDICLEVLKRLDASGIQSLESNEAEDILKIVNPSTSPELNLSAKKVNIRVQRTRLWVVRGF